MQVILLKESLLDSIIRDLVTFLTGAGLTGLGWWIGSDAMQWFGGVLFMLSVVARTAGLASTNRLTISEARKRLDEIEADSTK